MNYRNLVEGFFSFSIGKWLGAILGFVSTLILTRILTPDQLGKASMFLLVSNILLIFIRFGTDQAFVRFFYEEQKENRNKLLFNIIKIPLALFFLSSIFIILFKNKLSLFLFEEKKSILILILVITIFVNLIKSYSFLVIRMQQKGYKYSVLNFLEKLAYLLLLLLLVNIIGNEYEIPIYSHVIAGIIVVILSVYFGKNIWNFTNFKSIRLKNSMKDIFYYSYPLLFTTLITWLFESFDKIALKQWSTFEELGLYAAAFKIVALLNILKTSFTSFWVPTSLDKYKKDPDDKKFFSNIYKVIFLLMYLVGLMLIAFKDIIIFLLGSEYREAVMIMPFLVFMPIMYTISETTVIGISFKKKPKWHILIAIVSCLINILGNYLLVPKIGAKGAAISTGVSYILFFYLRTLISLKLYKVDYTLGKTTLLLIILVFYAIYSTFVSYSFMNSIIAVLILIFVLIFNFSFIKKVICKIISG